MRHRRSGPIAAVGILSSALVVTALLSATLRGQTLPGQSHRSTGRASASETPGAKLVKPSPAKGTESSITFSRLNWGKPVYVDNFNRGKLNLNDWTVYSAPYGSPHSGTPYTSQSVRVAHGYLNLIGHYQAPYGFVAGGIADTHNQTYGRWVIRFRADNGAGYEPAILLWPEGPHADGEIDIAEVFPGTALPVSTNRRGGGQFLHMGPGGVFIGQHIPASVNFASWHTVAVDWLPDHITMWIDGKRTWTVGRDYDGTDFIPSTPFHLTLQLDEGCTRYRCRPDSSTPPNVIMQVDWVKIYAAPQR